MARSLLLALVAFALILPFVGMRSADAGNDVRRKLRANCSGATSMSVRGDFSKKVKQRGGDDDSNDDDSNDDDSNDDDSNDDDSNDDDSRDDDSGRRRVKEKMVVKIAGARPFSSHQVYVDDVYIGKCRTNAIGKGKLRIKDPLVRPRQGSSLRAGRAQGVFFDERDGRRERLQEYEVRARPSRGNPDIKVDYDEEFEDGDLRRRFEVDIDDADPNRSYVVKVNGVAVARVDTDGDGEGELELTTDFDGDDDERPMPAWFPSLIPGDEVKVGSHTGVVRLDDD